MTITTEEAEWLAKQHDLVRFTLGMKAPEHDLTAATIRSLAAERDALQARVAELAEILSGLLETFEGVGFRVGQTHPPRTASYEEAEQHYAKNYQGGTALLMYRQWCQWRLACLARIALEGGKDE